MSDKGKAYLTPGEVARALMVSPVTVRQWAHKGWLEATLTAGGHRRFRRTEVERFARERGLRLDLGEGGGTRLLVVDDDPQLARYVTELVKGEPRVRAVAAARDGFEAGLKVRAFQPDVVLLDLLMPEMDGFAVCRRLRGAPDTRHIRIFGMTGYPSPENEQRILAAGAEVCLAKPVDRDQLLTLLGGAAAPRAIGGQEGEQAPGG